MFGFRDKGFPQDSLRLADETFNELFNTGIDDLSIMPIDIFIEMIRKENYNPSYLEVLAQLSDETALSLHKNGNAEKAIGFHLKTLQLLYLLNEKDKTFSFERELKITELEQLTRSK